MGVLGNYQIVGSLYNRDGEKAGAVWHTGPINEDGIQESLNGVKFVVNINGSKYLLGGK